MRRQSRAPLASRAATSRRHLGATLAAAAVMLASASAHGQEPARFERMIARDSARFVAHADPEVRGEAAWINAAEGGADFEVLRTLAQSGESAARQRAILALGHVRQPRAVEFLALQLQDITHRDEADAPLWAFALGSADPELAGTAVSTLLASILQGSYGRQRETILGLLAGLRQRPTAGPIAGLLRLFQDDSNREPEVRRLLRARAE
jgi:HEAT repeat protein